mmetsp:Transcript_64341/g.178396  ORF Transcript_64341/g.178396 Transcript_64341/m.178396 type:complete len:119 (+) Transcript_64341:72-428(+)
MAKLMTKVAILLSLAVQGTASASPSCDAQPDADVGSSLLTVQPAVRSKTAVLAELEEDDDGEEGSPELDQQEQPRKETGNCHNMCSLRQYAAVKCTRLAHLCAGCDECLAVTPAKRVA